MTNPHDALTANEQTQAVEREAAVPGGEPHEIDAMARKVWEVDGPVYTGWPNGGERVYIGYWDQYPREKERCFAIARALATPAHRPPEG